MSKMRKRNAFRLFIASKDGAFSFANEVPGVFEKADRSDGFVEITQLRLGHRVHIEAHCCEACRFVVFHY